MPSFFCSLQLDIKTKTKQDAKNGNEFLVDKQVKNSI